MHSTRRFIAGSVVAAVAQGALGLQDLPSIDSLLATGSTGTSGRTPLTTDTVEHALIEGAWTAPRAGDTVTSTSGRERTWETFTRADNGWFSGRPFRGGWAYARVDAADSEVALLRASGHRHVYINGVPRAGDVYSLGNTLTPIRLQQGANDILFRAGRGRFRASLERPPASVFIQELDQTLPDVLREEPGDYVLGVIVTNATMDWRGVTVVATPSIPGASPTHTRIAPLPPVSSRKAPIRVHIPSVPEGESLAVGLEIAAQSGQPHTIEVSLRVRSSADKHVRTFVSGIDGSVQYFAINPPSGGGSPGLVLSLHGASVEARGQAAAYALRPDLALIAPTNRRPFGFDWEDWGRLDALEVLERGVELFDPDPSRMYLTGHSMGGHGTWSMGAFFADRFAAIGPSAGWRDFWSYSGGSRWDESNDIEALLSRAANASRTMLMAPNYASHGVYILHGDADDNVPVDQARFMRERLGTFHPNFAYYERPGAGHWWGNQCMDWPPMFEFFEHNRRPGFRGEIDFTTVDPGISDRFAWVRVVQQLVQRDPSRITGAFDVSSGGVSLSTENVAAVVIDLPSLRAQPSEATSMAISIDGVELHAAGADGELTLVREGDAWTPRQLDPAHKDANRYGSFKDAFRHNVVFLVATGGTPEENAWSLAKARYDAETFWYRGNGSIEIVRDTDFTPERYSGRNVIIYGHRDMNSAWSNVLADSPIDTWRGRVRVGERVIDGDDLATLFIRPHPDSDVCSVGVVAGTGMPGLRGTNQAPYFMSGVHYPDWIVLDGSAKLLGVEGVVAAGYFAGDWSLGSDNAWRENP